MGFLRELKVELTERELLKVGADMAEVQRQKELEENAKKEAAAASKLKIDGFESKISELGLTIRNKYEFRMINCRQMKDYTAKVVRVFREDTGEEIEQHPMSALDLQQKLPKVDTGPDAPQPAGSIKPPECFDEVGLWQVWKLKGMGEAIVIAIADKSAVFRLESGDTHRVTQEMWAAHEPVFIRFGEADKPADDGTPPAAQLPQVATPDKVERNQVWNVEGHEVWIKVVDDAGAVQVCYSDDTTSYFEKDEWERATKAFLRMRVAAKVLDGLDGAKFVLDVLTSEPMTLAQIVEAIPNGDRVEIKRWLGMLVDASKVAKEGKGRGATYRLPS